MCRWFCWLSVSGILCCLAAHFQRRQVVSSSIGACASVGASTSFYTPAHIYEHKLTLLFLCKIFTGPHGKVCIDIYVFVCLRVSLHLNWCVRVLRM